MRFYLGVWNSSAPISDGEAAARYRVLSAEKSAEPKFDPHVYAFYCRLTSLYPELEMVPEDDLGSCPWACSLDVAGDHVIMAIQLEQSAELVPKVLTLAAQHELVCFDPQATKVHLPHTWEPNKSPRPNRLALLGRRHQQSSSIANPRRAAERVFSPTLAVAASLNSDV